MTDSVFDLIGIGVGPFNLSLAALSQKSVALEKWRPLFLERQENFSWHEGMILPQTTLQVPFLADMVSMVDPTHPLSFLNYLHVHGRLYHFYFYENFHIPREEYNHYGQWVASQLPYLRFQESVEAITWDEQRKVFHVQGPEHSYLAKHLVLGVGTNPSLPSYLENWQEQAAPTRAGRETEKSVFHTAEFAFQKKYLRGGNAEKKKQKILVVGSGQSAGECFLSLIQDATEHQEIYWVTRSDGFFPMEYSKLGLETFSPEYTEHFFGLDQNLKDHLLPRQGLLYKGMSFTTIGQIYDALYEATIGGKKPCFHIWPMQEVQAISADLTVTLKHTRATTLSTLQMDKVVLGTGYRQCLPSFLAPLLSDLDLDEQGRFKVDESYRIGTHKPMGNIYVQNGEIHTHGVGAPDLGLGAYRSARILNHFLGKEIYHLPKKNVFQEFSIAPHQREH